ncbi:MAG: asparagine synthase (glutamine-hydrolyzing) [Acidobacteria bacterium]|nr:asparagine synthase (glutamine-hydrolyzing) [Acidobacteriota bacterium]
MNGLPGPDTRATVERMCLALAHRGPDGAGVLTHGRAVLGHRRLAIIDLSPLGAQPMTSADGACTIVFNGEIYNFQEIRAELEQRGCRFRSGSDTEVLLAAYQEFGAECLKRLRGMFAFAIWDASRETLFAARDRLGKKPLCYRVDGTGFSFASEMQGLAVEPGMSRRPDPLAIHHFLTYGYVPPPLSAFQGVAKLPPAHFLEYREGRVRTERYWTLRYEPKLDLTVADARESVLEQLTEAVRLRLISDVPVGAFLSGGVDSSLVVALMAQFGRVKTYSIGFDEREYDERHHARSVAERYGTDHHEFVVNPDVRDVLPRLVRHYGEPYADSSAVPSYYLAKLTRQHVTVALNGDGGDESFAGYERYLAAVMASRVDWVPRGIRAAGARVVHRLNRRPTRRGLLHRLDRFAAASLEEPRRRYGHWVTNVTNAQKARLYTPEFARLVGSSDSLDLLDAAYEASDARSFLDATMHADIQMYLPHDLLVKVDIAAMSHGLEARSPLLDHKVVEFAARLPVDLKLRGTTTKYLLKEVARPLLPAALIDRPKMGFGVPIDHWLTHELADVLDEALFGSRALARGYFDQACLRELVEQQRCGTARWHHVLWSLLMLELWHREFVDGVSSPAAAGASLTRSV